MVGYAEAVKFLKDLSNPYVLLLSLIFLVILLWCIDKFAFAKAKTVLILGLNDAGKTVLFSKLVNKNLESHTYTSLKENVFEGFKTVYGKELTLVDFPGSERLRKQLFSKYFEKNRDVVKGVIFVVDSSTFSKKVRDVAEFLYDTLREAAKGTFVLVACNKQDIQLAKSSVAIRNALEREIGLINSSRSAALETTDGSEVQNLLTKTGKIFNWSDLPKIRIDFLGCCADRKHQLEDGEIVSPEVVRNWIDGIKI